MANTPEQIFPNRKKRCAVAVAFLLLALLIAAALPATGGTIANLNTPMNKQKESCAVVWDGQSVYVIGGAGDDQIVKFHPGTDTVEVAASLPYTLEGASTVWNGSHILIFGGRDGIGFKDTIHIFNPETRRVSLSAANLPSARSWTSAVWAEGRAFIFGGQSENGPLDEILEYDPANDTITVKNAKLPERTFASSVVWNGAHAYIFGGTNSVIGLDRIVRYDTASDIILSVGSLPLDIAYASAVWNGTHAFIFGGINGTQPRDEILKYDPQLGITTTLSTRLSKPARKLGAAWDGKVAYIIGGNSKDIQVFNPSFSLINNDEDEGREDGFYFFLLDPKYMPFYFLAMIVVLVAFAARGAAKARARRRAEDAELLADELIELSEKYSESKQPPSKQPRENIPPAVTQRELPAPDVPPQEPVPKFDIVQQEQPADPDILLEAPPVFQVVACVEPDTPNEPVMASITCPACEARFSVSRDAGTIRCPSCGLEGKLGKRAADIDGTC